MTSLEIVLVVLVTAANILGVGMVVPQVRRIRKTKQADGVSTEWIGASLGINVGWTVYAIVAEAWGLLPVSAGAAALYALMIFCLARIDPAQLRRSFTAFVGVLVVLVVASTAGQTGGLGLALALLYTVQFAPAAISAHKADDIDGVSPTTWWMALFEASIWTIYGAAIGDTAVLVGGAGASVMSLIVLAGLAGRRKKLPLAPNRYVFR